MQSQMKTLGYISTMQSYSKVVAEGMERVCSAFDQIVLPLGFERERGRKWIRKTEGFEELIFVSRSGSTYGAPHSASISLQLAAASVRLTDGHRTDLSKHVTEKMRRATGFCYHHRFNAEKSSTYDRCVEELQLFVQEVVTPWLAAQREPAS
ncbi:MAG: hypothetical protein C0491_04775 [Novosphingobium sp.]|nr:hypothetical protein [Novosphingobium sp.]